MKNSAYVKFLSTLFFISSCSLKSANFESLPDELVNHVFDYLQVTDTPLVDTVALAFTCKRCLPQLDKYLRELTTHDDLIAISFFGNNKRWTRNYLNFIFELHKLDKNKLQSDNVIRHCWSTIEDNLYRYSFYQMFSIIKLLDAILSSSEIGLRDFEKIVESLPSTSGKDIEEICSYPSLSFCKLSNFVVLVEEKGLSKVRASLLGKHGFLKTVTDIDPANPWKKENVAFRAVFDHAMNFTDDNVKEMEPRHFEALGILILDVGCSHLQLLFDALINQPLPVLLEVAEKIKPIASGHKARIAYLNDAHARFFNSADTKPATFDEAIERLRAGITMARVSLNPGSEYREVCKRLTIDQIIALTRLNKTAITNFEKIKHIKDFSNHSAEDINYLADILKIYDAIFFPLTTYRETYSIIMNLLSRFSLAEIEVLAKLLPRANCKEFDLPFLLSNCERALRASPHDGDREKIIFTTLLAESLHDCHRELIWPEDLESKKRRILEHNKDLNTRSLEEIKSCIEILFEHEAIK